MASHSFPGLALQMYGGESSGGDGPDEEEEDPVTGAHFLAGFSDSVDVVGSQAQGYLDAPTLEQFFLTLHELQEETRLFQERRNGEVEMEEEESLGSYVGDDEGEPIECVIEEIYLGQLESLVGRTLPSPFQSIFQPKFVYPNLGHIRNVTFSSDEGLKPAKRPTVFTRTTLSASKPKYMRMLLTLLKIHELITQNKKATKRELYYQNVEAYGNQRNLDDCIVAILSLLKVPRSDLNVVATSKGLVGGNLCYLSEEGLIIDCFQSKSGEPIPQDAGSIVEIRTSAMMILVVEKDATFQTLLQDEFLTKNSIIMTAKGMPDFSSRSFLKRLSTDLSLPIFGLFDADPYGIEIMLVYKYGSKVSSWSSESVAVPRLIWIGVLPQDLQHLDPSLQIKLSKNDTAKLKSLQGREYLTSWTALQRQLEILELTGHKAEIENISLLGLYLCDKIANREWIF